MRIAVIDSLRSPIGKYNQSFKDIATDDLAVRVLVELLSRHPSLKPLVSELIVGNVGQPVDAANVARVIALKSKLPETVPAFTVHRNCASGLEAFSTAIYKIYQDPASVFLAGGVESMSSYPFLFSRQGKSFFESLSTKKTIMMKLRHLLSFRFRFLKPQIALKMGLTDPICSMIMGETAEVLAKEFSITRLEQDEFALQSHKKAEKSQALLQDKIIPFSCSNGKILQYDEGIRKGQSMEALGKLAPFFDKEHGTVTAGNSSQISDGAAFAFLSSEEKAKDLKVKVLGFIKDFCYVGLDPKRMGLGPAFAIAKILEKNSLTLKDIDIFEINEAFSVQVLACLNALDSKSFCSKELGLEKKLGKIPNNKLNVYGGAVAVGHPVGMTGARIILQAFQALKNTKSQLAIVSLCVGGGQGAAFLLERK